MLRKHDSDEKRRVAGTAGVQRVEWTGTGGGGRGEEGGEGGRVWEGIGVDPI